MNNANLPWYQLNVTYVGKYVADYLGAGQLILFSEPAPDEIADYCVVHRARFTEGKLRLGQRLTINDASYRISATGEVATQNLIGLGHITLFFDGESVAQLPGVVHLSGASPAAVHPGDRLVIYHE